MTGAPQPDPFIIKDFEKTPVEMWGIINPDGFLLTKTVRKKRWEAIYVVTHGFHKWPQNWKNVYYSRGYRCIKIRVSNV